MNRQGTIVITTTYLGICAAAASSAASKDGRARSATHLRPACSARECAALYAEVGARHYWELYRIAWTGSHWLQYLQRPGIEISFIHGDDGARLGYLELETHLDGSVEIVNFGLRPASIGQGFGRSALNTAIARGFDLGATTVWLHTCSLDHPAALPNYYARGFEFIREERSSHIPLDPLPGLEIDAVFLDVAEPFLKSA